MFRVVFALSLILSGSVMAQAPSYTASNVVNASDYSPGPFAPGSLIAIFGTNLAFGAAGLNGDNTSGKLPFTLANVTVVIDNVAAPLLYVSPTQINAMVPSNEIAGNISLQVVRQGLQGPKITITLATAAPALFVSSDHYALAQDANASFAVATGDAPAQPGDLMVLYATGLGGTQPLPGIGQIPQTAGLINGFASGAIQLLLNGVAIDSKTMPYAGLTPGFAGLYQINFFLPGSCGPNPTIRLAMGGLLSADNVMLPVAQQQQ